MALTKARHFVTVTLRNHQTNSAKGAKPDMKKLSAKQQLASGQIIVLSCKKSPPSSKTVQVPDWLFDLATHTDEWIFSNFVTLHGTGRLDTLSNGLFTWLLVDLRAKHH